MYFKETLKNGLRTLIIPQEGTETVTVLVLVGTGSKYETKNISGISHFLEHMFFKGTKNRKTPVELIEILDGIGGVYNAFTGDEYTGFWSKVEKDYFDTALNWMADIYLNPTFPKAEMERERGVILEEFNMYLDNPMMYIPEIWKKLLYGDQPAGWDTIGNKKTIKSITRDQLKNYFDSQYVASNTLICVSGNINKEEALEKIKSAFKNSKTGISKKKEKVKEQQDKPEMLMSYKETGQTQIAIGFRGYDIFHKDRFVLEVMAAILGGNMSSRIFSEVREKRGLGYYVETYYESDADTGTLSTYGGLESKKIYEAIEVILNEYKKIREIKVPEKELNKAKNFLKGKLAISLESTNARANFYAKQEILKGEITDLKKIFKEIEKVSPEDIKRVAGEVMRPEGLNLALIGPFKEKAKFEKELLKF